MEAVLHALYPAVLLLLAQRKPTYYYLRCFYLCGANPSVAQDRAGASIRVVSSADSAILPPVTNCAVCCGR